MYNFVNCLQFNIRYEKVERPVPMGSALVILFYQRTCMIKARPKYPTDLYGNIYIDAGSRVDNVRHTSGYFFMLDQHQKEILSE
jgi:hypothetical protein